MKSYETKHLQMRKQEWLAFTYHGPPPKWHYFISPAMKSNVNRISFVVGWDFVSDRFHLGTCVNTLLVKKSCDDYSKI